MSYKSGEIYLTMNSRKVEIVGTDWIDNFPGLIGKNIEVVAYRFVGGSGEVYIRIASTVNFRPLIEVRVGDRIRYRDETRVEPDVKREVTYVSDLLVVYRVTGDSIKTREYATQMEGFHKDFEIA